MLDSIVYGVGAITIFLFILNIFIVFIALFLGTRSNEQKENMRHKKMQKLAEHLSHN